MILQEINRVLTYLLSDDNESIIIEDSNEVQAADTIFYLTQLFAGLKCDFKVTQLSNHSYELTLFN